MNQKLIIKSLFIGALVAFGAVACTYETLEPVVTAVPDSVSFKLNIIPVFNKSCNSSGCHGKSGIPPDLTQQNAYISLTFFGYVDTDVPAESIFYQKITTGTMKQFATDQDRALILKWIEQGALDN